MSSLRVALTCCVLSASWATQSRAGGQPSEPDGLSPRDREAVRRSTWTVARTLVFGSWSHRVQAGVNAVSWLMPAINRPIDERSPPATALSNAAGTKPLPLPTGTVARKPSAPPEVAALQRRYRTLVRLGLFEEAADVAARIAQAGGEGDHEQLVVHAVAIEHFPGGGVTQTSSVVPSAKSWATDGKRPLTCRFEGVSLKDVAGAVAAETGCSIEVSRGGAGAPPIHFSCTNLPADRALAMIAESCGWVVEPRASGVTLAPPLLVPLRDARLPILR